MIKNWDFLKLFKNQKIIGLGTQYLFVCLTLLATIPYKLADKIVILKTCFKYNSWPVMGEVQKALDL